MLFVSVFPARVVGCSPLLCASDRPPPVTPNIPPHTTIPADTAHTAMLVGDPSHTLCARLTSRWLVCGRIGSTIGCGAGGGMTEQKTERNKRNKLEKGSAGEDG